MKKKYLRNLNFHQLITSFFFFFLGHAIFFKKKSLTFSLLFCFSWGHVKENYLRNLENFHQLITFFFDMWKNIYLRNLEHFHQLFFFSEGMWRKKYLRNREDVQFFIFLGDVCFFLRFFWFFLSSISKTKYGWKFKEFLFWALLDVKNLFLWCLHLICTCFTKENATLI